MRHLSTCDELWAGSGRSKAYGLMKDLLSFKTVVECEKAFWGSLASSDSLLKPAGSRRVRESWQRIYARPDRKSI